MKRHNAGAETTTPSHGQILVPPMEEILGLLEPIADDLYDLGWLFGIKGTWHRLWASVALEWWFNGCCDKDIGIFVFEIRHEFEELLGRSMTDAEWGKLNALAKAHVEAVIEPLLGKFSA
jgi:hypothetical protein